MSSYSLDGKVALVTGAERGIGLATSRLLHARGASVAMLDLNQDEIEAAAEGVGERTLGLAVDVTDRGALEAAVASTVERFGGLDVVVANAGIAPAPASVAAMGSEEFERVVDVDLLGVYRTVRAALPQVIERQGHVVVIASVYAFVGGMMAAPYAMAKAGVEQLGRALRAELAPKGAGASVAYFGFIDTEMVHEGFDRNPIGDDLKKIFPKFLLKRLPPAKAGQVIVEGIEQRKPRIIAPKRWAIYSALRGIINPLLDAGMVRDKRTHALMERADDRVTVKAAADQAEPETTRSATP